MIVNKIDAGIVLDAVEQIYKHIKLDLQQGVSRDDSLLNGLIGKVIFLVDYESFTEGFVNVELRELIESSTLQLFEFLSDGNVRGSSISYGLAGYSWFFKYLQRKSILNFQIDTKPIDELILAAIISDVHSDNNLDFLHGYLGEVNSMIHFTETRSPNFRNCVDAVIDKLYNIVVLYDMFGVIYSNEKSNNSPVVKYRCDLGMAHGLSGVVVLLCRIFKLKINRSDKLNMIVTNLVQFLLLCRTSDGSYPHFIADGEAQKKGRQAWCYGDLCVAYAFLQYAKCMKKDSYLIESELILRRCCTVDITEVGVENDGKGNFDIGLCHGSGGLIMMYNAFLPDFSFVEEIKQKWYEITVHQVNKNIYNKNFYRNNNELNSTIAGSNVNAGLLYGYAGAGLALLSEVKREANGAKSFWNTLFNISE